jgi:hypothetical protein
MKRRLLALLGCLVAGAAWAQSPVYVSPDVPTTEGVSLTTLLPWQITRYDPAGPSYTLVHTVPGSPQLDAIHKMDALGDWIFSVESASDLGGALGAPAAPADVILFDFSAASYSLFFCAGAVGVPAAANVDALYLEGGDGGDLIVSFDVPTTMAPFTFEPSDTVRFDRTGVGCAGWTLAALNPVFDASGPGVVPLSDNLHGAAGQTDLLLTVDVPSNLVPTIGPVTYIPGDIASWDGANFNLYTNLAGWPVSSQIDGLANLANPGIVPPTILLAKAGGGMITITWSAGCSDGAEDYAIYQGTQGTWYDHTALICTDAGIALTETFLPAAASSYYLVVPHNGDIEGSYGQRSTLVERPVGIIQCQTPQVITPCP